MEKILFEAVPDLFASVGALFEEKRDELCAMDAKLGDGDLGLTMSKGYARKRKRRAATSASC